MFLREGECIALELEGLGTHYLERRSGQLSLSMPWSAADAHPLPQLRLKGPLPAFLRLATTRQVHEAKTLGLSLEGDATLLLRASQDWDAFKTTLLTGFCHRFPNLAQGLYSLQHQLTRQTQDLGQQCQDYLQDELGLLANPRAIADWMHDLDDLRDDVARLEVKLNHIKLKLKNHPHAAPTL